MKLPLHIVQVEDNPHDASLVLAALEKEGIPCVARRVQTQDEFVAALDERRVDIILSDFTLPSFDGLAAARIARTRWPNIPFIFISGTLGEERAMESLRKGATDYILKGQLARLGPAVQRAIMEVEEREKNCELVDSLRKANSQLQVLFEESILGIALVGIDGRPITTNTAFQNMLGYTGEELSRMPFVSFTHPDDCAADLALYGQMIRGERKGYQMNKRYIRKDGSVIWARLTVNTARQPSTHAGFAFAMIEDITERRELEAQFIESQKMEVVGQLASGVAHDFNNILSIIIGYSDMIRCRFAGEPLIQEYIGELHQASRRAIGLTRQLLMFGRQQAAQPVILDLNVTVLEMEKMLRRLIGENIEMITIPGEQLGSVKADSGHIGQVLMNLVVNARDAMPNGGKLVIALQNAALDDNYVRTHPGAKAGKFVRLRVSDNGTGMDTEVKARIFDAFFTTKPLGKGTGIGLTTCKTIVQQAGGFMDVGSEPGQGTTFDIYFPRVEEAPTPVSCPEQLKSLPRGTETLLVVEDDLAVGRLTCDSLKYQGYNVLYAANGQEALKAACESKGAPISLLITDVIMPTMGGKAAAEWLKTKYPDLKVIFTSGYADETLVQVREHAAEFAFLPKPYTPAALACKVRAMLDNLTDTGFLRKLGIVNGHLTPIPPVGDLAVGHRGN